MKHCRVLVTGAGSGVGQGIIKALRISKLPLTIISGDIAASNSALYISDEAVILPKVEEPGSIEKFIDRLKQFHIDVLMIGSEFDLEFLSEHQSLISEQTGAMIVVSPLQTIRIANDKWLTAEFLRKYGLPYAESYLPENLDHARSIACDLGYPIILKTRRGTSSRNVHLVRDEQELLNLFSSTPYPMIQRVIDVPINELKNEYTCSVFKTQNGLLFGPFTARRTLRGGTSWQIEVDKYPQLYDLLLSIGQVLDFTGSLNIQLMIGQSGPVPFELNARFSGTTAVRAHFGFNEPEMSLLDCFYNEKITQPEIGNGVAFRYHEEIFLDNISASELTPNLHKGTVIPWF